MKIISCDPARHGGAIMAIFNEAIINSTALYDYEPRSRFVIDRWFEEKLQGSYPIIGAESATGELMGFGTYGPFRVRPAYKYTVEHSVYVDARFRGQGVGQRLLEEVIQAARAQDYHVIVGGIDASNLPSIALHEKLGFVHSGTMPQVGFKFGRWLDLAFYQLILNTPSHPVDG